MHFIWVCLACVPTLVLLLSHIRFIFIMMVNRSDFQPENYVDGN